MARAKKSGKRLLIIGGIAVGLVAAAGGAYGLRQYQLDARAQEARQTGVVALEAGDYEQALAGLGRYLQRFGKRSPTSEDYLLYGRARRNVAVPNNQHLAGAIGIFRRALELDPSSREAQDELLSLYLDTHYFTEAQDLLATMIKSRPGDRDLLRKQADILEGLRNFKDALVIARELSDRPDAVLEDLTRTLRLMLRAELLESEVDAWLAQVAAARPGDRAVDLLRAATLSQRNDREAARKALDTVMADGVSADNPKELEFLIQQLDGTGRFAESLDMLEKLEDAGDPNLRREICRRLWFAGRAEKALERAERWTTDTHSADAALLAIRALSLASLNRRPEAEPLRAELAARAGPADRAWSTLVELAFNEGPPDLAKSTAALREAAAAAPDSALLYSALGDSCAAQGEWDTAVLAWKGAIARAPSWGHPYARLAAVYRTTRRPIPALEAARLAVARAPQSVEAVTVWVEALSDSVDKLEPKQVTELLKLAETLESTAPQTAQAILPVRIGLLARTDRRQAEAALRAILESPGDISEETLLRLADVAHTAGIPLEKELIATSQRLHGVTPRIALARAVTLAQGGGTQGADDGLRVLDELRAQAGGSAADPATAQAWEIVRASYLDAIGRQEAAAAWKAIAAAHPDSLPAQLGALASRGLATDRAAALQAVDRVKALTGDAGVTWRTARARILLDDPAAPEQDLSEAMGLLESVVRTAPENVAARLIYAKCQERLGSLDAAEEQLSAAAALAPEDPWIKMESARLAQRRGRPDDARRKLDEVLTTEGLAPEQLEKAAFLLASQGDVGRSADLLERLNTSPSANQDSRFLLAQLYARLGKTDQALALLEGLLERPTLPVLEATAQLYGAVGRADDAATLLAKLDGMDLQPGDRELVHARWSSRWESIDAAKEWFRKATAAAPDRPDTWTAAVGFALATGDVAGIDAALDDPRAAAVPAVRFLKGIRDVCRTAAPNPFLRSLLSAALADESARDVLVETVRVIARDWPEPTKRAAAAKTVQGFATANVRVLPLQLVAADVTAQAGDLRGALEIAKSTMSAFPNSAAPAQQVAQLHSRTGQWDEALKAGFVWRDRAGREDLGPDVFIASALLRLNRPADAASGLEPLSAAAIAHPERNENLLLVQAAALSRSGQGERAAKLLGSLAAASDRWRSIPLVLGPAYMGSGAESAAWLSTCAVLVPATDVKTRLLLARAWAAAWEQFHDPALLAGARNVLASLTARADAPPDAHFLAGTLAQGTNDLAGAQKCYEAALSRDPDFVVARNNLAMVLSDSGQPDAAVAEARRICDKYPKSSEFIDTLAYAYRKGGKFAEAQAELQRAIDLDPANPTWRISLAETLLAAGDVNGLAAVLTDIRKLETAGAPLTADQRARLEKIRPSRR